MANMTFSNAGAGSLFSGLAEVLAGPSPAALISADHARTQRDNLASATQINRQKVATMEREEEAMSDLADVLGDPTLARTAQGRANLISVLSQIPDGLKVGPQFAVGAAGFTQPNFAESDSEFSRILAASGVQPDWSQTPAGFANGLSNDVTLEQMKQESETARASVPTGGRTASLATVSPALATKFSEAIGDQLAAQFPGAAIDPATLKEITARTIDIYQITRNAPQAMQEALREFNVHADGAGEWNPGLLPWDWLRTSPGSVTHNEPMPWLGDVLAPPIDWAGEVRKSLLYQFPDAPISNELVQSLIPRATEIYQAGAYPSEGLTFGPGQGGVAAAVTRAIRELSPAVSGHREPGLFSAWNPFEWGGDPGKLVSSPVAPPELGEPAAEAPRHPVESFIGSLFEGLAHSGLTSSPLLGAAHLSVHPPFSLDNAPTNPSGPIDRVLPIWGDRTPEHVSTELIDADVLPNGPMVGYDLETGYYMVEEGRRVPLYRGSVIKSESSGKWAVFNDGRWLALNAEGIG